MDNIIDSLRNFWQLVRDVLSSGEYGFSPLELIFALGVFALFALARGILSRFVMDRAGRWVAKSKNELDDALHSVLAKPTEFFFLTLGLFFAFEIFQIQGIAQDILNNILRSFIAFGLFWVVHATIKPLTSPLAQWNTVLSNEMVEWFGNIIGWAVIAIGTATILQIWGIEVAPIIAGVGLFGVTIALGAQDLFKNLLAGVSILVEQRFKVGDWVEVEDEIEGIVEQIGFRSTRIRRLDKVPVTVPNNLFADHALINHSEMTHRRIYWRIGLAYNSTAAQLTEICEQIEQWVDNNSDFSTPEDVPRMVNIDRFADSSIDILIYTFTNTTDWQEWLRHKQDLILAIKEIVEAAGTSFAFPSRSIYIEQGDKV